MKEEMKFTKKFFGGNRNFDNWLLITNVSIQPTFSRWNKKVAGVDGNGYVLACVCVCGQCE